MSDHHDDLPPFCHPVAPKLLLAVFVSLIVLTILTVLISATGKSLGIPPAFTFPIAMIFATMKAFLVCAFFMHMWWEKGFNVLAFFSSILFAGLFIGMTLMDTDHYQDTIDLYPRAAETTTAE